MLCDLRGKVSRVGLASDLEDEKDQRGEQDGDEDDVQNPERHKDGLGERSWGRRHCWDGMGVVREQDCT